jgi:hypothetical protein
VMITKYQKMKSNLVASLLAALYLSFFVVFNLHHFFLHEHAHEHKVCRVGLGETHLHSEEYAPSDCPICQVLLPVQVQAYLPVTKFAYVAELSTKINVEKSEWSSALETVHIQPRAPPGRTI